MSELESDLQEYQRLFALTSNARVQAMLASHVQQMQDQLAQIPVCGPKAGVPVGETAAGQPFKQVEKFAWEQEGKSVKVYVTCLPNLKNHSSDKIEMEHTRDMIDVKIRDVGGVNYRFFVKQLSKPISDCRLKPSSKGFTLTLKKAEDGYWDALTFKASPLTKSKDEKDDKEPGAELMDMMRDMYQNVRDSQGDDDMRRAIGEAWTKSREDKSGRS